MIQVTDLSKNFRIHQKEAGFAASLKSLFSRKWVEKQALKNVNLKIEQGEILGLLGANGAGKTTLVKVLSGIIHPSSGEAKVLGYNPWERNNDFRRQIALIMGQKAQLWWDLPATDSFQLLREIYQLDHKEYKRTLDELVTTLGVQGQLTTQLRRLSLGERMKMELIAALLHKPKVVYLDEPTIGLDLTAQKAMRKFISEYRQKHKPIMILTSHYMEDIEALCERVAIIKDGEFVYDGNLQNIVRKFKKDRVVKFSFANALPMSLNVQSGEVIHKTDDELHIRCGKDQIANCIAEVMAIHEVKDIDLEPEEISEVIEKLIREGIAH